MTASAAPQAHPPNNFDFVRLVAASMVLYSHHFILAGRPPEPTVFGITSFGHFAVVMFFSLSGYLVTQSWQSDPHIFRFAMRRILRIWPALTAVVAFCALILGPMVTSIPLPEYFESSGTWNYFLNLTMTAVFYLPGVFEHNFYAFSVNGSLWTIPIEVQCYLVLAAAGFLGLMKKRSVWLTAIGIYLIWYYFKNSPDTHGAFHVRRDLGAYFLIGSAIYTLRPWWQPRTWWYVTAVVISAMLLWHSGWRHMASLLALPFCTIAFSQEKTPFICQIGRYGDFSYGMYLFAFPVQQMIVFLFSETLNFYAILALSFIITVGLSYLSWHLIEKPFLRMKPRKKESTFTYLNRTMGPIIKLLIPMSLSNQESSPAPVSSSEKIIFLKIFSSIALIYIAYIFIYWPGILGQDGLALILEAEGVQKSGKTPAWILFFNILYKPWRLVEVPIIIQLIICAILLSRILSWLHANNLYKSFWFCLVFIAIAPHLVFYNASLYSDGIYACALSSLLFEIWLTSKNKILTKHSFFILTLSAPFAIFGRPNGIINLIPLVAIIFLLGHKKEKIAIAGLIALCLAITFGASRHYKPHSIGSLFPMAIWETVNFLQPSVMNVHPPHVSELTIKTLEERKPIPDIIKYYDRDYWDPLYFFPTGPIVGALSKESQDTIIKEFYRYNLWVNLPRFISSRVHVFLVAAFAHGGFPGPTYAKHILEQTQSQSVYRLWNLTTLETLLTKIHDFNFKYRSLLWSPFLGIFLVLVTFYMSIKHKNIPSLIVSGTLFLQLLAIFFFSIAGEYRYLMSFFTAPLVMLPVFADFKKQPHQS